MTPRVQCPASCHSVLALRCLGGEHKSGLSPDVLNSISLRSAHSVVAALASTLYLADLETSKVLGPS